MNKSDIQKFIKEKLKLVSAAAVLNMIMVGAVVLSTARVMDLCPEGGGNCHYGDMDLSPSLFSYFSDLGAGKMPIEWNFADDSP